MITLLSGHSIETHKLLRLVRNELVGEEIQLARQDHQNQRIHKSNIKFWRGCKDVNKLLWQAFLLHFIDAETYKLNRK